MISNATGFVSHLLNVDSPATGRLQCPAMMMMMMMRMRRMMRMMMIMMMIRGIENEGCIKYRLPDS